MARPGYVDAAGDMLADFDRIDAENEGVITPSVEDSINHMAELDLSAQRIADHMLLDVRQVEEVLKKSSR